MTIRFQPIPTFPIFEAEIKGKNIPYLMAVPAFDWTNILPLSGKYRDKPVFGYGE